MNKVIEQLLENGRAKLRDEQVEQEKRQADQDAEQKAKLKAHQEAVLEAICVKLPEPFWGLVEILKKNDHTYPRAEAVLVIDELAPIALRLRVTTYPQYRVEDLWIVVPGIRFIRPGFYEGFFEGELQFPTQVGEREYGLDAWPYETADIEKALAIAEQRREQARRLDQERLEEIEKLKQQAKEEQVKREQLAVEQAKEFSQPKEDQIEPLAAMESWVRSICVDELAQRGL